ncbi:MAG TPA: hypothetical protein VKY74_07885 [Chloroflexia bacterium]|nr:hypothetical protein [Chloroflexia bacterium]
MPFATRPPRTRLGQAARALILLWLVACMDSSATPTVPASLTPAGLPAAPSATTAPPPAPALPTASPVDLTAQVVYATITALAGSAAATATAAGAPAATATPLPPPVLVPPATLGTYNLIITARAEGYRVYQLPGTLVLRAAVPGSGHSAELQIWAGVRVHHELADLSPGKNVGAIYLATRADLLPAGWDSPLSYAVDVRYNPATKFLTITSDPRHGLPGGWSTGPHNQAGQPRPITGGTIMFDLGRPAQVSGQLDLRSLPAGQPEVTYNGGALGQR